MDFVGREHELGELRAALDSALLGTGGVALIGGDAGVGKTTLARMLAEEAARRGADVAWGRCWEAGGAPAYWPWTQALRSLVVDRDPETLAAELGGDAAHLAQLVPELATATGSVGSPPAEGEHARFAVFDAVARFLERTAVAAPIVLVLDDLHAADAPSLLLLRFVARELATSRVLAIGTYRELEGRARPEVADPIGEVGRAAQTISLAGLSRVELAELIERRLGRAPEPELVAALLEATQGNPFFAGELIRILASRTAAGAAEDELEIPDSVRGALMQRLEHVPDAARPMLEGAAVLGAESRLDVLGDVMGRPVGDVLELMDHAARAGIVIERGTGRWGFSHGLFREVLYTALPRSRRVALHRASAEALERAVQTKPAPTASELAHHWFQVAAGGGEREKAIEHGVAAAREASQGYAYEQAAAEYLRTLDLIPDDADPSLACDLYIELGEAQWRAADTEAAKRSFERAHALARELGSPVRLAAAALGFGGRFAWVEATGGIDRNLVSLIEGALEALEDAEEQHDALRVRLLARLATQLYFSETRFREAHETAARAVELANATGDPATLAYALNARRFVLWGSPPDDERLRLSGETLRAAKAAGDTELILRGHGWRIVDFLEIGDLAKADREAELHAMRAEELRQPLYLAEAVKFKAMRALMTGRLDEAERLLLEFGAAAERTQDPDITQAVGIQLFFLRGLQARMDELEAGARAMVERYPALPAWRCSLAYLLSEVNRLDEARTVLTGLAEDEFAWTKNRSGGWMIGVAVLAEVCAALGDGHSAERLYEVMLPFAGTNCVVGYAAGCFGAMDRSLGVLAAAAGRFADAEQHLAAAVDLNTRMAARPWIAWSKVDQAALLLLRNAEPRRAEDLLREAAEMAVACGATRVEQRARGILDRIETLRGGDVRDLWLAQASPAGEPVAPEPRDAERPEQIVFAREGDFWAIGAETAPARLKDAKGLHYLARLLSSPEHEFHALELAAEGAVADPGSAARRDASGLEADPFAAAGTDLDVQATSEYRTRIEGLREEVEEAERFGDVERAARAREELEFLATELSRAVGLGGRRRAGSPAEKARVNVTRAIRTSIKRIAAGQPSLARHLEASVRTGTFCSYVPEPRSAPEWRVEVGAAAKRG